MTLGDINQQTVREIVDHLAAVWLPSVVPLFTPDPKSKHRSLPAGTGFVFLHEGEPWLATAEHVLANVKQASALIGNFAGRSAFLSGCGGYVDQQSDIAVIPLDRQWAKRNGISSLKALPVVKPLESWEPIGMYVLFGYPQSKNRLNSSTGETNRHMVAYSLGESYTDTKSVMTVTSSLAFKLDHKAVCDVEGSPINLGVLDGTSGGPIVEVFGRSATEHDPASFTVSLAAVMSKWYKGRREIVGSSANSLLALVNAASQETTFK